MWNWHFQTPADYGTRYDYGLVEIHKAIIADWKAYNERQPDKGWIASMLLRYRGMVSDLPPGMIILDQIQWLRQPQRKFWGKGETGTWQLTRGGVAACWAIETAGAGDDIILVGFDVIKAGIALPVEQAFSPEYMSSKGFFGMGSYKPGKTKEGNHDYAAEKYLIQFLARRSAVNLYFAEDIWI